MSNAIVPLPAGVSPERLSFAAMMKRAEVFARTALVPDALQGKPEAIVLVGARGAALGVPFELALQEIHIIKNRTFASAQLRLALIRRAGHEVRYVESSSERAVIKGRRKENRHDAEGWVTAIWTIADAERAGLLTKEVWKGFPADMLRARAAGALSRMEFSDVLLGMDLDLDTAEEAGFDVGQDLDEPVASDGGPIDDHDDGGGEVIDEAVVVDDLAPGPETDPTANAQPSAPGETPAGRSAEPQTAERPQEWPVPHPKPGERQDVADVKWRRMTLPADERAGFDAWVRRCGIPDDINVSPGKVRALDAELDRRGATKLDRPDPADG